MKIAVINLLLSLTIGAGLAIASSQHHEGHEHGHDHQTMIGEPGLSGKVDRTATIEMNDQMRFVPDHLTVKQGETIQFFLKNDGRMTHEFVLGSKAELMEHAEMMERNPDMEHEDPGAVSVAPGKTGEVIWHFTQPGEVDFACLIPGHFEAGMKGAISVDKAMASETHVEEDQHGGHHHEATRQ